MLSSDQWARRAVFLEEVNRLRIRDDLEHKECVLEYIEKSIEELNKDTD